MLIKKGYLLNVGIKAYLFYGEKISCNTGKSIIALWKSYVHKCSKHDKGLWSLNKINSENSK